MPDDPEDEQPDQEPDADEPGDHEVPGDLTQLHEVLEYKRLTELGPNP